MSNFRNRTKTADHIPSAYATENQRNQQRHRHKPVKEEEATENANIDRITNKGGAGGNRTLYLFNAIEALSQMSYSPPQRGAVPADTAP